jgi:hypothetical protein
MVVPAKLQRVTKKFLLLLSSSLAQSFSFPLLIFGECAEMLLFWCCYFIVCLICCFLEICEWREPFILRVRDNYFCRWRSNKIELFNTDAHHIHHIWMNIYDSCWGWNIISIFYLLLIATSFLPSDNIIRRYNSYILTLLQCHSSDERRHNYWPSVHLPD